MLVDPQVVAAQAAQNALALANYQKVTVPYTKWQLARAQQDAERKRLLMLEDRTRARDAYFSRYSQAGLLNSGIANQAAERFTFDTQQADQEIALALQDARQTALYNALRERIGIGQTAADGVFDIYGQSATNYGGIFG